MQNSPISPTTLNSINSIRPEIQQTYSEAQLPFTSFVESMIESVDSQQETLAINIDQLSRGETDNLQALAANAAKADLSFRFLMEIRDKLIASYQEVMRMQV